MQREKNRSLNSKRASFYSLRSEPPRARAPPQAPPSSFPSRSAECSASKRSFFARNEASSSSIKAIRAVAASSFAVVAARPESTNGTFRPTGRVRPVESEQEETAHCIDSRASRTSRESKKSLATKLNLCPRANHGDPCTTVTSYRSCPAGSAASKACRLVT